MGFIYSNPNTRDKKVGDCVKRALTIASGINYHDIEVMLNRFKKITHSKKYNDEDNWRGFVTHVLLGSDSGNMQFVNHGKRYTVEEYSRICDCRAIMQVAKHLVACDGKGNYLDTWQSGEKSIYKVYKLPDYDIIVWHIRRVYPGLCKGLSLDRWKLRVVL